MPTALIIGVTGSLGSAIADVAARDGFRVFGTARTPPPSPSYSFIPMDITDDAAIERAVGLLPPIDLLVFAQGSDPCVSLADGQRTHILKMLDIHVAGTLICLKHFRPLLADNSLVVLFSSNAATKGSYDPAYAAAKGAIAALTRSLVNTFGDRTRVNTIAPGLVQGSSVYSKMPAEHVGRHSARMFKNRLVSPPQVARLVMEMYRNESMNGAVVPLDGGYSH
jgi:3-oxoacyl-[acyl-carrier protein] reductase